ncbi:hypothetical protein BA894_17045 [Vibrio natriegens]|nr:hypothetical protein BA894_17045 [Vibrio natriegens]
MPKAKVNAMPLTASAGKLYQAPWTEDPKSSIVLIKKNTPPNKPNHLLLFMFILKCYLSNVTKYFRESIIYPNDLKMRGYLASYLREHKFVGIDREATEAASL